MLYEENGKGGFAFGYLFSDGSVLAIREQVTQIHNEQKKYFRVQDMSETFKRLCETGGSLCAALSV